jgi:hypothetical protein
VDAAIEFLRGNGFIPLFLAWCIYEGVISLAGLIAWLRQKHGKGAGGDK